MLTQTIPSSRLHILIFYRCQTYIWRENVVADTLVNVVDFVKLANAQESDPELKQILKDGSALQLQKIHLPGTKTRLYCDFSAPVKDLLFLLADH
ncbi:hypothetical protein EVAR_2432_1 [Eumeta japonica]|uniref:Uncharacterized protein n=1 Tax=Eumeta variegata TaxID=151549 RepID=A0A4C1SNL5_EUMVA|nr:hypothetical protein EVAR_2432_1 [Eumeta japonica]